MRIHFNVSYKKFINRSLLLLLFFYFIFVDSQQRQNFSILFVNEYGNKRQSDFVKKNNLRSVIVIYQDEFVTNDKFDVEKLKKVLPLRLNNSNNEIVVLDWEGRQMENLFSTDNKIKKKAITQFYEAIIFIKNNWPNIKVGFYGLPSREFWNPDDKWIKRNSSLDVLYKTVDFIAPSIYLLYDREEVLPSIINKYIERNIELALRMAKFYNKEVYPFVWHRYHTSNKNNALGLVSNQYFGDYIDIIINKTYHDKRIKGLIWWNAETYYLKNSSDYPALILEYKNIIDTQQYQTDLFERYLKIMLSKTKK